MPSHFPHSSNVLLFYQIFSIAGYDDDVELQATYAMQCNHGNGEVSNDQKVLDEVSNGQEDVALNRSKDHDNTYQKAMNM